LKERIPAMSLSKGFTDKHPTGEQPDQIIKKAVENHAPDGKLACAVAFKIASELGVPPGAVGKTADLMGFELVKCQLGLFGYAPDKKIIKPKAPPHPDLENAIASSLVDHRLPCASAWDIAGRLKVSKMTVSGVCEHLGIKIKPCQLGAF